MTETATNQGIAALLDRPFFTGAPSASASVPGSQMVALNGRPYMVDLSFPPDGFKHESIPLIRRTFDTTSKPGEGAINPEDLWRRTQETWHLGAGQIFADRDTSIEGRFYSSKGVNVWTKWQASLLPDTQLALSSSNTNLYLVTAGAKLYVTDGQVLKYTSDITAGPPATWTSVTGNPAVTASSVTSDGYDIWTSYGASGIYQTTTGAAAQTNYTTGTVSLVRYVKGRLMAANGASIYNVITGGGAALPTALFTHGNSDFSWVDFGEGPGYIYAAGYSGDKSIIYKIAVRSDGTSLDPPIVAGELPSGEIVRSLKGYLGYMVIGTDKGFRCANIASSGYLTLGPLIGSTELQGAPASAVKAFEPNGRFVWFGWSAYDGTSSGLGRIDLSVRTTDPLTPAWASDLMASNTGAVNSVASLQGLRAFSISGVGVYAETAALVSTGTLISGMFGYGIVDNKTAVTMNVRTLPLAGSYSTALAANDGAFVTLGSQTQLQSVSSDFAADQVVAERFGTQITLNVGSPTTTGPTLKRFTLKADPSSALNRIIHVPLLLSEREHYKGRPIVLDPSVELALITTLRSTGKFVTYQEGTNAYTVRVKDFIWYPKSPTSIGQGSGFNGTLVVELKTIE